MDYQLYLLSSHFDVLPIMSPSLSVGIFIPLLLNSFDRISAQVFIATNSLLDTIKCLLPAEAGKNAALTC